MNDTSSRTSNPRPDLAWGQILRGSTSGSFIEDQLVGLVRQTGQLDLVDQGSAAAERPAFRVDVIHIDPNQDPA